ncbi:MAG: hypothetical protein ABSA12_10230 [Verrucomicrobiia bacterium]
MRPPASGEVTAAKQFIDKGRPAPDEIRIAVVRLLRDEQQSTGGFVFDEFLRTGTHVDSIRPRARRQSCENCGALYH